jgi:hypothetical protein
MTDIIRDAPLHVFLVMLGLPLAMAAVAVAAGLNARRQARLVRTTDSVPIASADDGYREFEGHVEPIDGQLLAAPLTGAPCCWFSARVEEWKPLVVDRTQLSWHTIRSITSSAPFFVRDDTGVCMVQVDAAEVTPTDKSQWTGATLDPEDRNPPRILPSGSTEPIVELRGGTNHRYRYFESRIYAGDPLLVAGMFKKQAPIDADDDDDDERDTDRVHAAGATRGRARVATRAEGSTVGAPAVTIDESGQEAWTDDDIDARDDLTARARKTTRAVVRAGGRGKPLIVTTTTRAEHLAMTEFGSQAAFMVALVPLGIALLVLLARFN